MLDDLKKELLKFIKDINNNIKDEEDLLYITKRLDQLVDGILKQTEKILDYKEKELSSIINIQEIQNFKLQELQNRVDNLCEDIYEDDIEDEFQISCPYCGSEFNAYVDDEVLEISCPECSNRIELDWSGNLEDEQSNNSGCSGSCSQCGGCES